MAIELTDEDREFLKLCEKYSFESLRKWGYYTRERQVLKQHDNRGKHRRPLSGSKRNAPATGYGNIGDLSIADYRAIYENVDEPPIYIAEQFDITVEYVRRIHTRSTAISGRFKPLEERRTYWSENRICSWYEARGMQLPEVSQV